MEPKSSKNASKCKMKRYQKKEPIFDRFLVDLGSILGGFWAPKSVLWGPKSLPKASLGMPEPQRSPKSAPRSVLEANLAPFWLHLGPTWRHFGSILAQLGAFCDSFGGQNRSKKRTLPRRPKTPQESIFGQVLVFCPYYITPSSTVFFHDSHTQFSYHPDTGLPRFSVHGLPLTFRKAPSRGTRSVI